MAVNDDGIAGERQFPTTSWSAVRRAQDLGSPEHQEGLAWLVERYWRPVYYVIRFGHGRGHADAKDLTQQFFSDVVLERNLAGHADAGRGTFRALVRTAITRFLSNEVRDAERLKRGGGLERVALPDDDRLALDPGPWPAGVSTGASPEALFDAAWAQAVLAEAVKRLEPILAGEGDGLALEVFRRHDLSEHDAAPTYADLADALNVTVPQVKHALHRARAELRAVVAEILRPEASSPAALGDEIEALLG